MPKVLTRQQNELRTVRRMLRCRSYVGEENILTAGMMVRNWKRNKPGEYVGHFGEFTVRLKKGMGIRLEDDKGEVLTPLGVDDMRGNSPERFSHLSKKILRQLLRKKQSQTPVSEQA